MRISPHFTLAEFTRSETAKHHGIQNIPGIREIRNMKALCLHVLEPLRKKFQKPVRITSGYRSKQLNDKIDGSKYSQHKKGEAADIVVQDIPVSKVFQVMVESAVPFDQCIYEKKGAKEWIHISHKSNRRELLMATISADGKTSYREL